MTIHDSDKLANLLAYIQSEGRICPLPQEWNELWEILPGKVRKTGGGWEPPLPLILTAWHHTGSLEKMLRFKEHIEYAAQHGVLDEVDAFLRRLPRDQWHMAGDA